MVKHNNKKADGWQLDIDDTGGGSLVENITYEGESRLPDGKYEVIVELFDAKGHSNVGYKLSFSLKIFLR